MEVKSTWEKNKLGQREKLFSFTDFEIGHIHEALLQAWQNSPNKEEAGIKFKKALRDEFLEAMN